LSILGWRYTVVSGSPVMVPLSSYSFCELQAARINRAEKSALALVMGTGFRIVPSNISEKKLIKDDLCQSLAGLNCRLIAAVQFQDFHGGLE
jgi:hypothetical protein